MKNKLNLLETEKEFKINRKCKGIKLHYKFSRITQSYK